MWDYLKLTSVETLFLSYSILLDEAGHIKLTGMFLTNE